jgi:DUF4097 and DUF4098 domain-containing protein YvlB
MIFILAGFILGLNVAAETTVNKSIHIEKGERHSGSCTSVNGSIEIDEGAEVSGGCKTVNGSIRLAEECYVHDLQSVNGSIHVGEKSEVRSDIETVNGGVDCKEGVQISGEINTVNGSIKLTGAKVEEDISTYNGSISLTDNAIAHSDIIIKDNKGHNDRREPLRITIDNSVVEGDIINREDDIEVIVYLRNGGTVKGEIIDARVEEE